MIYLSNKKKMFLIELLVVSCFHLLQVLNTLSPGLKRNKTIIKRSLLRFWIYQS